MNPVLLYIIKTAFYLAAFYLVYSLFLSKDTLYARNRLFILLSLAASLLLPFVTIQTSKPVNLPLFGKTLSEVLITGDRSGNQGIAGSLGKDQIPMIIYLAGIAAAAIKLLVDFIVLFLVISKSRKEGNRLITFTGLKTAAFTAFGHIFINGDLSPEVADEVRRHEQNHLEKNHSFDILLVQLIKVFQWFNPFIYLFEKSLREVHEYQADENYLSTGTSISSYQQLIMNQVLETRLFSISNSFSNPTLVKKRMIMMTKERSGILANLKILMVVPVVAVVMLAFSSCGEKSKTNGSTEEIQSTGKAAQTADTTKKVQVGVPVPPGDVPPPPPPPPVPFEVKNGDTTWVKVDVMPEFRGGDQGLLTYIGENTVYPENAKKNGIQGKVIVRFAVETNGSVDKVKVIKGVEPELDAEALRVVKSLPAFIKPGLVQGRPVAVWYMIPINFALK